MRNTTLIPIAITALLSFTTTHAANTSPIFDDKIQTILQTHFNHYKDQEYFSGISLAINTPNTKIKNYYIGNVSHDKTSKKISSDTLFQIGSITKSFTAAIILQLEKEHKLNLNDTIKMWLPQYTKWSPITIKTLLNMTSGLPNYSDTPLWNTQEYNQLTHAWTNVELIDFVYPKEKFNPPLKTGYFYSNTGYVLTDLIAEKASKTAFPTALTNRTIKRAELHNTYYPIPNMDASIQARVAKGYNYNQYDNPALVGTDLSTNNLTWAAAAGGIVSNAEDIIKWVKALFMEDTILDADQKKKMMELISTKTGKSVASLTKEDSHGFGLGVAQAFDMESKLGHYWFYEGSTMGFRALYFYVPCNGVIVSSIFNSATNEENDHAGALMKEVYQAVLMEHSELNCTKDV